MKASVSPWVRIEHRHSNKCPLHSTEHQSIEGHSTSIGRKRLEMGKWFRLGRKESDGLWDACQVGFTKLQTRLCKKKGPSHS